MCVGGSVCALVCTPGACLDVYVHMGVSAAMSVCATCVPVGVPCVHECVHMCVCVRARAPLCA